MPPSLTVDSTVTEENVTTGVFAAHPELEHMYTPETAAKRMDSLVQSSTRTPTGVILYGKLEELSSETRLDNALRGLSSSEIAQRMLHDLDFLSLFMFPAMSTEKWPPLIHAVWALLVDSLMLLQPNKGEAKFAIGIPRGFAKTTLMKLYAILALTFTRHTFILIVGSVDDNAESILKDIISALDSPQYRALFGHWDAVKIMDRQDQKVFYLGKKQIILKAKGGRTSLRGLNTDNRRPDIILMDDMQNEENARSPVDSDGLLTWMISTLMPTRSDKGAIYLYIGNTYAHKGSIMQRLVTDPDWVSLTLGAILSDGTSLWPGVHPIEALLSSYRTAKRMGKEAEWLAQMMNAMEISRQRLVDLGRVSKGFVEVLGDPESLTVNDVDYKFIVVDPASTRVNADDVAIVTGGQVRGNPVLFEVSAGQRTPLATIKDALNMAMKHGTKVIFVEEVAYQETLLWWFNYVLEAMRVTDLFEIRPISPGSSSKLTRILHSFQQMDSYDLLVHPDAYIPWKNQLLTFDRLRTDNADDILDATHYVPIICSKYDSSLRAAKDTALIERYMAVRNAGLLTHTVAPQQPPEF